MNESELKARIAERIARAKSQLDRAKSPLDRSDAPGGATTSVVSSEVRSLVNESACSSEARSLANRGATELLLANESAFPGELRAAAPRNAPAARSEGVASPEARQPKSDEPDVEAETDDTMDDVSGRFAPRHEDGDGAAPRSEPVGPETSQCGATMKDGGDAAPPPPPGALIKRCTYVKLQLWDNGFQPKNGRARYRVKLYGWMATRPAEINPWRPDFEWVIPLPATTKRFKRKLKELSEEHRAFGQWGLEQLEIMEARRGDMPHPFMGWPQMPQDINGTQRDYDYLLFVDWTRDEDGAVIPRFVLIDRSDLDGMVLGMEGMVAETYGKPNAPGWLGYHDTIGYNDFRKSKREDKE
jgi:hypothetical protein